MLLALFPSAASFRMRSCAGVLGLSPPDDAAAVVAVFSSSDNIVLASFPTSLLDLVTVAMICVFPLCCCCSAFSLMASGMGSSCLELLFVIRRPLKDFPATLCGVSLLLLTGCFLPAGEGAEDFEAGGAAALDGAEEEELFPAVTTPLDKEEEEEGFAARCFPLDSDACSFFRGSVAVDLDEAEAAEPVVFFAGDEDDEEDEEMGAVEDARAAWEVWEFDEVLAATDVDAVPPPPLDANADDPGLVWKRGERKRENY